MLYGLNWGLKMKYLYSVDKGKEDACRWEGLLNKLCEEEFNLCRNTLCYMYIYIIDCLVKNG